MVTETVGDPKALEAMGFLKVIKPELVVPMVTFLASGDGDLTHQNFSACGGRFARVFVGLGEGWLADAESEPTADDVAAHLSEVTATEVPVIFCKAGERKHRIAEAYLARPDRVHRRRVHRQGARPHRCRSLRLQPPPGGLRPT